MEPHEYETMAQVEDTHWWYVGMRRITTVLLHTIPTPARVIDAGCGTGGNLRTLRPAPAGHGFDQHPLAVAVAAERGSSVVRADIQAIPFNSASADLVTCFDVLYHRAVGDDAAALRELARVVKPGGYVLLRLPPMPGSTPNTTPRSTPNAATNRRRYARCAAMQGWTLRQFFMSTEF